MNFPPPTRGERVSKNIAAWPSPTPADRLLRAGRWLAGQLRKWRARPRRKLRLCESLPLGERRFVAVVEFEQQRFLIGGSGSSIAMLAQLAAPAVAQREAGVMTEKFLRRIEIETEDR